MNAYKQTVILIISLLISFSSFIKIVKSQDESKALEHIEKVLKNPEKQFSSYKFDPESGLISRVKKPPGCFLKYLRELDNKNYTVYNPSQEELHIIEDAFNDIPPLIKKVLKEKLIEVCFISDFLGSGLTDWIVDEKGNMYCVIVFNPVTLKMNMSEWLSFKEKTCFINNSEEFSINVDGGSEYSAFLGILLHEAAHVVDYIMNFTPYVEYSIYALSLKQGKKIKYDKPFVKNIWIGINLPLINYNFPLRNEITFYGLKKGPKINISLAAMLYRQISGTPFISLYGSMSWTEDLAEFIAFYHLTRKLKQPYVISVLKNNTVIYSYEPLMNHKVIERFDFMKKFYE